MRSWQAAVCFTSFLSGDFYESMASPMLTVPFKILAVLTLKCFTPSTSHIPRRLHTHQAIAPALSAVNSSVALSLRDITLPSCF